MEEERMRHINPAMLQVGDCLVTTDAKPFASLIRGRTWGWKSMFNLSLGTHCTPLCDRGGGLFYACEMQGDGLDMTELTKYDNPSGSWLAHIVAVGRSPLMSVRADEANDYMIKMHSFKVRYGWDELVRFLQPRVKSDPYRLICSEWMKELFVHVNIPLPVTWKDLISPADWQKWIMGGGLPEVPGVVS
jgi:hypothetical protein